MFRDHNINKSTYWSIIIWGMIASSGYLHYTIEPITWYGWLETSSILGETIPANLMMIWATIEYRKYLQLQQMATRQTGDSEGISLLSSSSSGNNIITSNDNIANCDTDMETAPLLVQNHQHYDNSKLKSNDVKEAEAKEVNPNEYPVVRRRSKQGDNNFDNKSNSTDSINKNSNI